VPSLTTTWPIFTGYPALEGNLLDEALLEDEGFDIPKQNPNKHDDPDAG